MLLTRSFSAVTSCLEKLRSAICTDTGSTLMLDSDVTPPPPAAAAAAAAARGLSGDVDRLLDVPLVNLSAEPDRRTGLVRPSVLSTTTRTHIKSLVVVARPSALTTATHQGWKKSRFFRINFFLFVRLFYLNQIFWFFKFVFSHQGFTTFLKLVCLLNHTNNMAAMLLLFPVILLLSKK